MKREQHDDRAILLRVYSLNESSLITRWMTLQFGIIKAVAKGAKRPRSPFLGKLVLFVSGSIQWTTSPRSELFTLRRVEDLSYRETVRSQYNSLLAASYFTSLLDHSLELTQPSPEAYDLLERALNYLLENQAGPREVRYFEKELSRILGYSTQPEEVRKLYQAHQKLVALRARLFTGQS